MKILWKNDTKRFGIERRSRANKFHWHIILFHWNICLGNFENKKYVDPIELFYSGLCKK